MKNKKILIPIIALIVVLIGVAGVWYFTSQPALGDDITSVDNGITSRSLYITPYELHNAIEVLNYNVTNGEISNEDLAEKIQAVIYKAEGSGLYSAYKNEVNTKKWGKTYGALPDENPIGGGKGYTDIITKGDYNVKNADQLVEAAKKAKSGEIIFIEGSAKIDLTAFMYAENYTLELKDGVTLASNRGQDGSKGGMIFTTAIRSKPMIKAGENVRITGFVLQGPDPEIRDWKNFSLGEGITTSKSNLEVDNMEISGFNFAAISITGGDNHKIHHNYIHHNRSIDVGYGVSVKSAKVIINYNLFNYNRTSIYGNGRAGCGLEISNNIQMGTNYKQVINMETVEQDGKKVSGDYLKIYNNTFLTDKTPFVIKALPENEMTIDNNYFPKPFEEYSKSELFDNNEKVMSTVDLKDNEFDLLNESTDEVLNQNIDDHTEKMRITNITSRNLYGDIEKAYEIIKELKSKIKNEDEVKTSDIKSKLQEAVKVIEGYGRFYEYIDKPNMEIDGEIYGAVPDDNPLGGGFGYSDVITTGDYVVETAKELIRALLKAKSGEVVFVKGTARIDLTTAMNGGLTLNINDGVTLASDRGNGDSPGALLYSNSFFTPMIKTGENVRITGITLKGADPKRRVPFHSRSFRGENPKGSGYYYKLNTLDGIVTYEDNLEVDNCEISGFSHGGILISGGTGHYFHHNYIHHNQRNGLGYGIVHSKAVSLIEYNLFNANRHDLAGTGAPGTSYEAYNNVQMGISLSHNFDMHGGRDRGDGTDIAGDYVYMNNNTFLSDEHPYWLRGTPKESQEFYNNLIYPSLNDFRKESLYGDNKKQKEKVHISNNVFNAKNDPVVIP